jgi:cobalt-zinc-cadmium efflux system outer membrane protein
MCLRLRAATLVVTLVAAASAAQAQTAMTLADVLTRARERAPQIVSARLALDEARGRLIGASLRAQTNPELDVQTGNRQSTNSRWTDLEVAMTQRLEPGSRRSARIDGANAAIAQGAADIQDTTRAVLHAAARAYYRAVHARERVRLLTAAQDVATGVYAAADRRFRAGDIAVLDVNLARASMARVRAEREATEALHADALGELKRLLGVDSDLTVQGDLGLPPSRELAADLEAATQRPELKILEASLQEAEADVRLGQSLGRPDYGVGVRYARESGDHILLGGLTITLPVFAKGLDVQAIGLARATRVRAEFEAARTRAQIDVRSAFDVYERRAAAVRILQADALPGIDESDALITRSFDVGQLGLPDVLLIRREILETRFQYLDALLEAAQARADLDASAGILR